MNEDAPDYHDAEEQCRVREVYGRHHRVEVGVDHHRTEKYLYYEKNKRQQEGSSRPGLAGFQSPDCDGSKDKQQSREHAKSSVDVLDQRPPVGGYSEGPVAGRPGCRAAEPTSGTPVPSRQVSTPNYQGERRDDRRIDQVLCTVQERRTGRQVASYPS